MVTHRADYILDRGVWIATCRVCGYGVSDRVRRRAADQFRLHIQEELARAQAELPGPDVSTAVSDDGAERRPVAGATAGSGPDLA